MYFLSSTYVTGENKIERNRERVGSMVEARAPVSI